jgi:predicted nucleic acid-binding protein
MRETLTRLVAGRTRLVITDLVVAELHGLTLGRVGPSLALALVDAILGSPRVRLLATGPPLIAEGLEFVRARPGRRLSLVDATSFLVMRREGIVTAFALDEDFVAEGFAMLP